MVLRWYERLFIKVLKMGKIPRSIAIIMDGNRRFATKNQKAKHEGHTFGLAKLEQAMDWALHLGIKELTVFALSTDNLKRSQVEVDNENNCIYIQIDTLMRLAKESFARMAENGGFMQQNGIQVKILGDLEFNIKMFIDVFISITEKCEQYCQQIKINYFDIKFLPDDVAEAMRRTEDLTKQNDQARLNVCLCYNSKYEILEVCDSLSDLYAKDELKLEHGKIKVEDFEKQLYGGFNCKPEILIRTSNEIRMSNFLLYQTDESQYQFIASLWPDFSIWDFTKIILDYQSVMQ